MKKIVSYVAKQNKEKVKSQVVKIDSLIVFMSLTNEIKYEKPLESFPSHATASSLTFCHTLGRTSPTPRAVDSLSLSYAERERNHCEHPFAFLSNIRSHVTPHVMHLTLFRGKIVAHAVVSWQKCLRQGLSRIQTPGRL